MSDIHTPGHLYFRESPFEPNRFTIMQNGNWLMAIQHNGEQLMEVQRENMRRLVACWNACADEELQYMVGVVALGKTLRKAHDETLATKELYQHELCDMERKRDELVRQRDDTLRILREAVARLEAS